MFIIGVQKLSKTSSAVGGEIAELVDTGGAIDLISLLLAFCSASERIKLKYSTSSSWLHSASSDDNGII